MIDFFLNERYTDQIYKRTFHIKADITDDIYSLYVLDSKKQTPILHGTAIVPDYKTSVFKGLVRVGIDTFGYPHLTIHHIYKNELNVIIFLLLFDIVIFEFTFFC